jgi:hypothetical protein
MRGYYYDFFSYTTSVGKNLVTNGVLSTVDGATTNNCKQGAFLRETGRRLYPGTNPGVSTMLVSVFDFKTGLTGFIDPNSEAFTPQNSDRAYYIDSAGYNPNHKVSSDLRSDQGPPVYTHGDVLADGDMYIGGNASTIGNAYFASNVSTVGNTAVGGNSHILGNASTMGNLFVQGHISTTQTLYAGGGEIVSGRVINNTITSYTCPTTNIPLYLDCSLGNIFNINIATNNNWTLDGSNIVPGQQVSVIFNNVFVPSNNWTPTIVLGGNIWETAAIGLSSNRLASVLLMGYYEPTGGNTKLVEIGRANTIVPA